MGLSEMTQAGSEIEAMEHIGNKMAVLLPIVSIAPFLNLQGLGDEAYFFR
jgi:hypothetical protein